MSNQAAAAELVDNQGVWCERAPTCLLCGEEAPTLYSQQRDRFFSAPGSWNVRYCGKCDLAWLDPRPLQEEVFKLYRTYYTHSAEADAPRNSLRRWARNAILAASLGYRGLTLNRLHMLVGRLLACFQVLRDLGELSIMGLPASKRGRVLDVGCGNGSLLEKLRELGWQVEGLEPDQAAAGLARTRGGLLVHVGTIDSVSIEEKFDAIVMNHVLEHLHEPIRDLRTCCGWLAPGGVLVMTTPNLRSLGHAVWRSAWPGLDVPRHLFVFSRRSLRRVLEQAGLEVRELRTASRIAAWVWQVSWGVWRRGRVDGARPDGGKIAKLTGGMVQLAEALSFVRGWGGEELVAVGELRKGTVAG